MIVNEIWRSLNSWRLGISYHAAARELDFRGWGTTYGGGKECYRKPFLHSSLNMMSLHKTNYAPLIVCVKWDPAEKMRLPNKEAQKCEKPAPGGGGTVIITPDTRRCAKLMTWLLREWESRIRSVDCPGTDGHRSRQPQINVSTPRSDLSEHCTEGEN